MSESAVKVGIHRGLKALARKHRGRLMKTDELDLAAGCRRRAGAAERGRAAASSALVAAVPLRVACMAFYGVRSDLVQAMFWPMFWVKLLFPACVAVAGFVIVQRLARPGVRGARRMARRGVAGRGGLGAGRSPGFGATERSRAP